MISGNMVGSYSQMGKTFILLDENGNEITGVVVDQETIFTAGDNDVRDGMIYASDDGVSTGTKDIPPYRTTAGYRLISPKEEFCIPLSDYQQYDYTVFQCMITLVDMNDINNSVATSMVSIKNGVYAVNSTTKLANVVKDHENMSIKLNVSNDSNDYYFIYYFTYRQEE